MAPGYHNCRNPNGGNILTTQPDTHCLKAPFQQTEAMFVKIAKGGRGEQEIFSKTGE